MELLWFFLVALMSLVALVLSILNIWFLQTNQVSVSQSAVVSSAAIATVAAGTETSSRSTAVTAVMLQGSFYSNTEFENSHGYLPFSALESGVEQLNATIDWLPVYNRYFVVPYDGSIQNLRVKWGYNTLPAVDHSPPTLIIRTGTTVKDEIMQYIVDSTNNSLSWTDAEDGLHTLTIPEMTYSSLSSLHGVIQTLVHAEQDSLTISFGYDEISELVYLSVNVNVTWHITTNSIFYMMGFALDDILMTNVTNFYAVTPPYGDGTSIPEYLINETNLLNTSLTATAPTDHPTTDNLTLVEDSITVATGDLVAVYITNVGSGCSVNWSFEYAAAS